jgi:hypothetical protein
MAPSRGTDYNQTPNAKIIYVAVRLWVIRSMVKRETAQIIR